MFSFLPPWVRRLTIVHSLIIAAVLIGVAVVFFRRGLIHMGLWLAALAVVIIGIVNFVSYGPGG